MVMWSTANSPKRSNHLYIKWRARSISCPPFFYVLIVQMEKQRKSLRLPEYDYSSPGAYFVTLVTHDRLHLFGEIKSQRMVLSKAGSIAKLEMMYLEHISAAISMQEFIIMPDHIHAIIIIVEPTVGVTHQAPSNPMDSQPAMQTFANNGSSGSPVQKPITLGTIISQYKSRVSKRILKINPNIQEPIWQRGYYERIIRDEIEYEQIAEYIRCNPMNWVGKKGYPRNSR